MLIYKQFQSGHIVRGIDFSDDPVLQGRLYSYSAEQIRGPNFEQAPVNRPRVPIHNNNRGGKLKLTSQRISLHIHRRPSTSAHLWRPIKQSETDSLLRQIAVSLELSLASSVPTFADHWSQPVIVWNSLSPEEQQIAVNVIRFETAHITSTTIR
jgi:catalase